MYLPSILFNGLKIICGDREMAQDPKYFPNPDEFIPERYLDTDGSPTSTSFKATKSDVLFAFGFGRRYIPYSMDY